ncbi:hypothetical protein SOVF_062770 [Spinacia oleracea]|nr:hypothetical protein SOVF_062770 [Spinacia oleracea]
MMQSCSSTRQKVSWSDLPQPLLQSIVKLLGNDLNSLRRFRSVCNNWRQSTAYPVPPSVNNHIEFSSSVILLRRGGSDSISTPWMVFSVNIAPATTMYHKGDSITSEIVSLSPLFSPKRVALRNEPTDKCDDIVHFRQFDYSVDWKGNLYYVSQKHLIPVCKPTACNEVELHEMAYRKRLVTRTCFQNLFLVARNKDMLRVY